MSRFQTLPGAALLFVGAFVVHNADHARRGVAATSEAVVWSGTVVGLLAAVSITLILVRHPTAPAIAAVVFPAIAFGVTASHILPEWSVFSDPLLVDSTTDGWSIAAASGEIIASVILGALAVRVLMGNGYTWRITEANWA